MNSRLLTAFLSFLMGLNTALLIMILIRIEQQPVQQQFATGIGAATPAASAQMVTLPSFEDEALALTGSQRNKIARIKERWEREELERRARSNDRMGQMPEVLMGNDLSIESVRPLMDQAHEDSRKRMEMMMGLFREYQEVLTPEQRQQFRKMLRERHRAMGEGRGRMSSHPDDARRRMMGERQRRMMGPEGDRRETFGNERHQTERSQETPRQPQY